MKENKNQKKFIYDKKSGTYVFDDGISINTNPLDGFKIYYAWVCEKVENNPQDYYAWKELLSFLSLEKYRAYVEKDEIRIRFLEMGMLLYISQSVKSQNWKIRILGYRQAVKWGYPSVIIHGKKDFFSEERFLLFLNKMATRYYPGALLKSYNVDLFARLGKFDEFLFALIAISIHKKNELVSSGKQTIYAPRDKPAEDSDVDWNWLIEELNKAHNAQSFKSNLGILKLALSDFLNSKLKISAGQTLRDWKNVIEAMKKSHKKWQKAMTIEEEFSYEKYLAKFNSIFNEE